MTDAPPSHADHLAGFLEDCSSARGTQPAIADLQGFAISYDGLRQFAVELGQALRGLGIAPGARLGLVAPRGPSGLVAFLALATSAAVAPLNPKLRPDELAAVIRRLRLDALLSLDPVSGAARAAALAGIAAFQGVGLDPAALHPVGGSARQAVGGREGAHGAQALQPRGGAEVALLMTTSGSTGQAKVVPLSHANILSAARGIVAALELGATDRCLNPMPLFHVHGLLSAGLASLAAGGVCVCTPPFDADMLPAWLRDSGATWLTASPTMHLAALERAGSRGERLGTAHLRFVRSSSAPLPSAKIDALEAVYGAALIETYGLTETASMISANPLPPGVRKPGSVGVAVGAQIAIAGELGEPTVRPGQRGEVLVQGPSVIERYEADEAVHAGSFRGPWLRTGDAGYLDDDGYLYITHRLKEVVKRGGEQVMLAEIDAVLNQHPAVRLGITYSVPHPTLAEDIVAAVEIERGVELSARDLKLYLLDRLATYKVPSEIVFVDELPRNAAGKVLRSEVRRAELHVRRGGGSPALSEFASWLLDSWREVLQAPSLLATDNLLLAGADPLRARWILDRIAAAHHLQWNYRDLLLAPTVVEQARWIASGRNPG